MNICVSSFFLPLVEYQIKLPQLKSCEPLLSRCSRTNQEAMECLEAAMKQFEPGTQPLGYCTGENIYFVNLTQIQNAKFEATHGWVLI